MPSGLRIVQVKKSLDSDNIFPYKITLGMNNYLRFSPSRMIMRSPGMGLA
jgi:hypothetical protein